MKGQNDLPHIW